METHHQSYIIYILKLRMEMGYVSKGHKPDQRAENSQMPLTGVQYSRKIPDPEAYFWLVQLALIKNMYYDTYEHHTELRNILNKLKLKIIQD